jgi:hypothetical protein
MTLHLRIIRYVVTDRLNKDRLMKTASGNGPTPANEDFRVRQILAEAVERMKADKIHPTAIFLALIELVATFAACDGEEHAFALAMKDIESCAQKWSADHEKQKQLGA